MGAIHLDGLLPGPQALWGLVSLPEAEPVSGPCTRHWPACSLPRAFPWAHGPSLSRLLPPCWCGKLGPLSQQLGGPHSDRWSEAVPPCYTTLHSPTVLTLATTARAGHTDSWSHRELSDTEALSPSVLPLNVVTSKFSSKSKGQLLMTR